MLHSLMVPEAMEPIPGEPGRISPLYSPWSSALPTLTPARRWSFLEFPKQQAHTDLTEWSLQRLELPISMPRAYHACNYHLFCFYSPGTDSVNQFLCMWFVQVSYTCFCDMEHHKLQPWHTQQLCFHWGVWRQDNSAEIPVKKVKTIFIFFTICTTN